MDWKATFDEILAERRQELGEPPSLQDLVELRAGELSDEAREKILERAAVDPEVARQLFAVLRFPDGEDEDVAGVDERWQTLRQRLAAEGDLLEDETPPRRSTWLPLAATFALGVAVALLFGSLFRSEAPEPARLNLRIVELLPVEDGAGRRGTETVRLADGDGGVVLTLAAPDLPPASEATYSLEITRPSGTATTHPGLVPGPGGVFVLDLPRAQLEDGVHELRLSDQASLVARFRLEVQRSR